MSFIPRRRRKRFNKSSRYTARRKLGLFVEHLEARHLLATLLVNSTADGIDAAPGDGVCDVGGGVCTLRGAIQESNALPGSDTVSVPAGTYALTIPGSFEDGAFTGDLDITDDVIVSGAAAATTIIDASAIGDRVFHIPFTGVPKTVSFLDVTIRGGTATDGGLFLIGSGGGGILSEEPGAVVTLADSVVTENTALGTGFLNGQGGGVAAVATTLTITNSEITNNDAIGDVGAMGRGGGLYAEASTTTLLIDSVISGNQALGGTDTFGIGGGAAQGGGIFSNGTTWSMVGSTTVDGNLARGGTALPGTSTPGGDALGGGIYSEIASSWTVTLTPGSTISRNDAIGGDGDFGGNAQGGGIYSSTDSWTIENNTISNNTAVGGVGDPVFGVGGSGLGGGLYTTFGGAFFATFLTIAENDASGGSGSAAGIGEAGGVFADFLNGGTVGLGSTIVASNTAGTLNPDVSGSFFSSGYNLIGIFGTASGFALPDLIGTAGSPIDPMLGPLMTNGGPTETHLPAAGSPAIDAADPIVFPAFDQLGVMRPIDGDAVPGAIADIGAVEVAAPIGAPAIDIEKFTNGVDADTMAGQPLIPDGGTATFTYTVTNTGGVPLTGVVVTDSVLGPIAGPVSGDLNSNSILDVGEIWMYTAMSVVTPGQYMNTGSVTADDPMSMPVTDMDDSHHFGVVVDIDIEKATDGDDADAAPGPAILVGGTATFTYEVTTGTGNVALDNVKVTDDNGTPSFLPDDFNPPPVLSGGFNVGDTNMDGLLDPGETWQYSATATVTAGLYENAAVAEGDDATNTIPGLFTDTDLSHHFGVSGADFTVTKKANLPHVSSPGDVITYTITVTNNGGVNLTDPVISDPLLGGLLTQPDADVGTMGVLDIAETWTFTRNYAVSQAVFDGNGVDANGDIDGDGDIDNTVTVDFAETDSKQASEVVLLSSFCNGAGLYRLHNHPVTPGRGLTLAGYFGQGDAAKFNFDHALSDIMMTVTDSAISIGGIVYGGDLNNPARWHIELTYSVDIQSLDDDMFATVGTGTLTNLATNEVIDLTPKIGMQNFAFELGDGFNDNGLLDFSGITGWGWLMYNGQNYVPGSDGAFTAELMGCSTIIDNGDAGFSSFSAFQNAVGEGFQQDMAMTSIGGDTATWTFEGLTAGATYGVSASWMPVATAATNAPYTITNIVGGDVTVEIDQTVEPSDFSEHGTAWQELAVVRTVGTSLTVQLSGVSSGEVIADAIRVEPMHLVPDIEVQNDAGNIINGTIDFGTFLEGEVVEQTIRVQNVGTAPLDLGSLLLTGGAQSALDTADYNSILAADESTSFKIVLDTSTAGNYDATVLSDLLAVDVHWSVIDTLIIDDRDPVSKFTQSEFTNFGTATFQQPQGYLGNLHYLQGADPAGKATWTFNGLPDGFYRVAATWYAQSNRATDSPFKIYLGPDDGTPDAWQSVNQQLAPNDFTADGVGWEIVNSMTVTGGTLTVTLDNAISNASKYVIADAVRIQRIDPSGVPEIDVLDGHSNVISGGIILPTVLAGATVTEPITIQNLGSGQLNLGAITIGGDSQISLDTTGLDTTLRPGQSTTFDVMLDTSSAASYLATVTIPSDDPDESSIQFTVEATVDPLPPVSNTLIIDNGDTGFSASAFKGFGVGYNKWATGYEGDFHYHAARGGSHTATWTFDDLAPGIYQVAVTWVTHANRATSAPFTVSGVDNGGTKTIYQRTAPSSYSASFEDQGATWVPLDVGGNGGNFQLSGSTLTVTLGTSTTGYVIADAVRIERVAELLSEPEIEVLDGGTSLSVGSIVDLGSVAQASPHLVRTITVKNVGTAPLNLGTLQISTGTAFSLDTSGLDTTLDQNESTTFDVVLNTSTADSYMAIVTIPSNDVDESSLQFTVGATVDATPPAGTVSIIDNGDAGFSAPKFKGFGVGYNQWVQGYQGNFHYHARTSVSQTATWTFDGLTPGIYQVAVTWATAHNRATDAPFTVSGVVDGGTKTIYQRTAPSSYSASFEDDGAVWVPLDVGGNGGNFQLSGSTLTVTLGTSTTGYVIADAVRIEKLSMLRAESTAAPSTDSTAAAAVRAADATGLLDEAIARWSAVDPAAAARLSGVSVQVADLPGNVLGLALESTGRIWIDTNAAGHGWVVSGEWRAESREPGTASTQLSFPSGSQLSALGSPLSSSFDLLTVVTHELGHVLGLPDLDHIEFPNTIMADRLAAATRRLPGLTPSDRIAAVAAQRDWLFAEIGHDDSLESDVSDRQIRDVSHATIIRSSPMTRLIAQRINDDDDSLEIETRSSEQTEEDVLEAMFAELTEEFDA